MTDAAGALPVGWSWVTRIVRTRLAYPLVLLLVLAAFLPGFTTIPAIDRDEARFAQSSRQMLESGDPIRIRLQDEPRLKKPVGIYWMQAAATALMGGEDPANPIWTYRIPSLLGALAAVLLTLRMGRDWLGPEAGFAAALLLGCCLLLGTEARLAKTDAVLLALTSLAQAQLGQAWLRPDVPLGRWRWIGFWAATGLAILVKGPIQPMVAVLTALALSIGARRTAWLKALRPWPGLAITAAIALPWLIAITIVSGGAFWSQSVGADMGAKLAQGQEAHGAPPGTSLLELPLMLWPGSLALIAALPWIWRHRRRPAIGFCLAWVAPSWLMFELVPTKLPHYVLPLYPALALMAAAAWSEPAGSTLTRPRAAGIVWALAGTVLGLALLLAAPLGDHRVSAGGALAGLVALGTVAFVLRLLWRGATARAFVCATAGGALALALGFGLALTGLDAPWIAPRMKAALDRPALDRPALDGPALDRARLDAAPVFVAGYAEPSAVIALGTATRLGGGAEAADFLAQFPDGIAFVAADQEPAFRQALAAEGLSAETGPVIAGFNYSKGRRVALTPFRRSQP